MGRIANTILYRSILILTLIAALFFTTGCSDELIDAITTANEGDDLPFANVEPANGSTITGHERITLTFEESVSTGSLVLGGEMESTNYAWDTINFPNDTLYIDPDTLWPEGNSQTLTIMVDGFSEPADYTVNVFHGVCVTETGGSQGFTESYLNGSTNNPRAGIPDGITAAYNLYLNTGYSTSAVVRVAGGDYTTDWEGNTDRIVMVNNISLYGGYAENDWGTQDTAANVTTITDLSDDGGDQNSPNRVIESGSTITTNTVIDGFTLITGNDPIEGTGGNSGIYCEGSPTINNNIINGRSSNPGNYSMGIVCWSGSEPVITNNTINILNSNNNSRAIFLYFSDAIVSYNSIHGGTGSTTYGIFTVGSSTPEISDNTSIDGGDAANSRCIYIAGSTPVITGNFITLANNASGYGIYETSSSDPISVSNNNVYNCPSGLYYDNDLGVNGTLAYVNSGNFTDITVTYILSTPTGTGNTSTAP